MGLIKGSITGETNVETFSSAEGRKVTEDHGIPAISPLFVPDVTPTNKKVGNFEDAKSKRILIQGILQAVVQSQGLLLEPGDYIEKVKKTTLDLVKFVEENSK